MTREQIESYTHHDPEVGELTGWQALRRRLYLLGLFGEPKDAIPAIKLLHERAFGLPKQALSIEETQQPPAVNWSDVPIERRKAMLDALHELEQYTASPPDGPTEH